MIYSLVKTEANVWENPRADQRKSETQWRVSPVLPCKTNESVVELFLKDDSIGIGNLSRLALKVLIGGRNNCDPRLEKKKSVNLL